MTPLTADLGVADLAVLERWACPSLVVKAGARRVTAVIARASRSHLGAERATEWVSAAQASVDLHAGHPAVALTDLAAEVATESASVRAARAELAAHATERGHACRYVGPGGLARSLPGLAEVGGPALVAAMGDPSRLRRGKSLRSLTGGGAQGVRDR